MYDLAVIVCGGRDYADRARVFASLDRASTDVGRMLLIHGAARGADRLAAEWAEWRLKHSSRAWLDVEAYPADWDTLGKAAGPTRNAQMLDRLVTVEAKRRGVIAFPGGTGTAHMTGIARRAGIAVWCPLDQRAAGG